MPKISVIVPVYKAEEYLAGCIDSILSQTFSDFEVILMDDGSPDNSYAICRDYTARDSRIQVLQQENQGQAAARNHALAQAKGEWLCYVDSDDVIHPQMLELLYHAAADSGAAISMCEMWEGAQIPDEFYAPRETAYEVLAMEEPVLVQLYDADRYPAWVACAKLIRRELVEQYPFQEGRVYEDNEAVCRWVCSGKRLAQMDHRLYFYRKNPESTTQSSFSLKKLDYLWALESIIRYYGALGYEQMKARFASRYADAAAEACYGVRYMLNRPEQVKPLEMRIRRFLREETIHLTKEQFEALLDAAHPKLIRLYWPLAGGIRTLQEAGVSGVLRKLKQQLGKGAGE